MEKFTTFTGLVAPIDRANIDTDAIMPKQFLKSIKRTGYGEFAFDEWRYLDKGVPGMDCSKRILNKDFSLNRTEFKGANILLVRDNFGCGSSREHAPWGLLEYGFKVILAPSFADIFYNNSIKNGLLPIVLTSSEIDKLFSMVDSGRLNLTVNLSQQEISGVYEGTKINYKFDMDTVYKNRLLDGLDDIELVLQDKENIQEFESKRLQDFPWV